MELERIDLERMALDMNMDATVLRSELNFQLNASTLREVADSYAKSLPGSESHRVAFQKWAEICRYKLSRVTVFEEAYRLYYMTPFESDVRNEVVTKLLEFVKTPKDARRYSQAIAPMCEIANEIFEKWKTLCEERLSTVTTFEEAKELYYDCPGESRVDENVLRKWVSLVKTVEEARQLLARVQTPGVMQAIAQRFYTTQGAK